MIFYGYFCTFREIAANQLTQFGPASSLLNGSRHIQWHCVWLILVTPEGRSVEPQSFGKHSISQVPLS